MNIIRKVLGFVLSTPLAVLLCFYLPSDFVPPQDMWIELFGSFFGIALIYSINFLVIIGAPIFLSGALNRLGLKSGLILNFCLIFSGLLASYMIAHAATLTQSVIFLSVVISFLVSLCAAIPYIFGYFFTKLLKRAKAQPSGSPNPLQPSASGDR